MGGMSLILVPLTMVLPKASKSPGGHARTMGNDALTNGMTSSLSVPKLKNSIMLASDLADFGTRWPDEYEILNFARFSSIIW